MPGFRLACWKYLALSERYFNARGKSGGLNGGRRSEAIIIDLGMFPSSFNLGPIHLAPATVLAPMAGVTDTVFRRPIRAQGGCGLIMTEFTSSHGIAAILPPLAASWQIV
jgi:hypothetical protein